MEVAATVEVLMENAIDVALVGTVIELGTVAAGFALDKVTMAPPTGAGLVKLTVPPVVCPPVTVEELTLNELKLATLTVGL